MKQHKPHTFNVDQIQVMQIMQTMQRSQNQMDVTLLYLEIFDNNHTGLCVLLVLSSSTDDLILANLAPW